MGTRAGDINANFSINKNLEHLIQQIEPLAQKRRCDINMSPLLDEFHKNVVQSEMYLQNGVFCLNFGKAATFLDYAFNIYSKQVDLLWDMAVDTEKRFISYEKDSQEKAAALKAVEEKAQKGKRGRRKKLKIPDVPIDAKQIHALIKNCHSKLTMDKRVFDYKSEKCILSTNSGEDIVQNFSNVTLPKSIRKRYPNKYLRELYIPTPFRLELDEEEYYDNKSLVTNMMEFLFPETMRRVAFNKSHIRKVSTIGPDVPDVAFQKYLYENGLTAAEMNQDSYKDFQKFLKNYLNNQENSALAEQRKKLCPRRSSVFLTRLSDDVVQKYMKQDEGKYRRDSGFSEVTTTDTTGNCEECSGDISNVNTSKNDSSVLTQDSLTACGDSLELTSKQVDNLRKASLTANTQSNTSEIDNLTVDASSKNTYNASHTIGEEYKESRTRGKKQKLENIEDLLEEQPRKKKMRKTEIMKWLKTTTAALKKFENFFSRHYLVEDGEGQVQLPDTSSDEEDYDDDATHVLPVETILSQSQRSDDSGFHSLNSSQNFDSSQETISPSQNSLELSQNSSELSQNNLESSLDNLESSENHPNLSNHESDLNVLESPQRIPTTHEEFFGQGNVEKEELQRRYFEWSRYIRAELKRSANKDFDIHEYGTKILDFLNEQQPVMFKDIVNSESEAEVARYFAATLQLTNTENVELLNWEEGKLATCLQLNLLSLERHHEHLEKYKAPSEDTLQKNIKKIKNSKESRDDFMKRIEREHSRTVLKFECARGSRSSKASVSGLQNVCKKVRLN